MENNKIDLFISRCTYWEGKLYCLARDFNLAFSVDSQTGVVELLDVVPEGDILTPYLCGDMNAWGDKLIFTPNRAKKIWLYDLSSKHWDGLTVNKYEHWGPGGIYQTYVYENKLFLIGGSYPAIICLDLKNNSCDYIEEPYEEIMAREPEIDHHFFRLHGVRIENTLYLASCLDNFVLKFDMETRKHQWIKVGEEGQQYVGIAWDGSHFWLSPFRNTDFIKWDGNENIKTLSISHNLEQEPNMYLWGARYDGSQIIFPCVSHPKSIRIDTTNDTLQFYDEQYSLFKRFDNGVVVNQTINGDLTIRTDDSSPKTYHPAVDVDELAQFYEERNKKVFLEQTLYYEGPKHFLTSLEGFTTLAKPEFENNQTASGQVGKTIWEAISKAHRSE
ncbi:MAG: hypothetical protein NC293_13840 [Roseburia sp.]|nr:hypothetical protein [Roseburia sp.]